MAELSYDPTQSSSSLNYFLTLPFTEKKRTLLLHLAKNIICRPQRVGLLILDLYLSGGKKKSLKETTILLKFQVFLIIGSASWEVQKALLNPTVIPVP